MTFLETHLQGFLPIVWWKDWCHFHICPLNMTLTPAAIYLSLAQKPGVKRYPAQLLQNLPASVCSTEPMNRLNKQDPTCSLVSFRGAGGWIELQGLACCLTPFPLFLLLLYLHIQHTNMTVVFSLYSYLPVNKNVWFSIKLLWSKTFQSIFDYIYIYIKLYLPSLSIIILLYYIIFKLNQQKSHPKKTM